MNSNAQNAGRRTASKQKKNSNIVLQGRPPTRQEDMYFRWADRWAIDAMETANSVCEKLFLLSASFLGGSTLVLDRLVGDRWLIAGIQTLLLISALAGFIGFFPRSYDLVRRLPDIEDAVVAIGASKQRWMLFSGSALLAAFLILLAAGIR